MSGFVPTQGITPQDQQNPVLGVTSSRPYRLHRIPACDRCRTRKIRCVIDLGGEPCLLCRVHNAPCRRLQERTHFARPRTAISKDSHDPEDLLSASNRPRRLSRGLLSDTEIDEVQPERSQLRKQVGVPSKGTPGSGVASSAVVDNESSKFSMILGPSVAEDVQVIEKYMSSGEALNTQVQPRQYNTLSDEPKKPISYMNVPRRREGFLLAAKPGEAQAMILTQVLRPFLDRVVALYVSAYLESVPKLTSHLLIQLL